MKNYLYIYSCICLFSSCIIQFVGITNDYDKLTKNQKDRVKKLINFSDLEKNFIYELTGPQLMKELDNNTKSLIYYPFNGGCSDEKCTPLQSVLNYVVDNEYKLYLIVDGFYGLEEIEKQQLATVLFAIDSEYYNSNKTKVYKSHFEKDIGLLDYLANNKYLGSFLFYEKNKIVDVKEILN